MERERGEAATERAVQRTTEIVQQGMTDLKKVELHTRGKHEKEQI